MRPKHRSLLELEKWLLGAPGHSGLLYETYARQKWIKWNFRMKFSHDSRKKKKVSENGFDTAIE